MRIIERYRECSIAGQVAWVSAGIFVCLVLLIMVASIGFPGAFFASKSPTLILESHAPKITELFSEVRLESEDGSIFVTENVKISNSAGQIAHGFMRNFLSQRPIEKSPISIEVRKVELTLTDSGRDVFFPVAVKQDGHIVQVGDAKTVLPQADLHFLFQYRVNNAIRTENGTQHLFWLLRAGFPWSIESTSVVFVPPKGLGPSDLNSKAAIRLIEIEPKRRRSVFGREVLPFKTPESLSFGYQKTLSSNEDLAMEISWKH